LLSGQGARVGCPETCAQLDSVDNTGHTALHWAASSG
jgi:hypothetical protein